LLTKRLQVMMHEFEPAAPFQLWQVANKILGWCEVDQFPCGFGPCMFLHQIVFSVGAADWPSQVGIPVSRVSDWIHWWWLLSFGLVCVPFDAWAVRCFGSCVSLPVSSTSILCLAVLWQFGDHLVFVFDGP
jgi:hypothetical protein